MKVTGFSSGPTSSGWLTWYAAKLSCGHSWSDRNDPWQPIKAVAIGDDRPCEMCEAVAKSIEWIRALDVSTVHHVRFRENFGGRYTFYKLDPTSPSMFRSIGGCYATPEIDKVLQEVGLSPISPTERA